VPKQSCCRVQSSDSAAREQLEKVVEVLDTERCISFEDCIAWARHRFQVRHGGRYCAFPTEQEGPLVSLSGCLTKGFGCTFPENAVSSTGTLLWSAPKRFQHALNFSMADAAGGIYWLCTHPADSLVCFSQYQFHERIAQLVYTFPEDAVTSTGSLFWSAPKRFPHALNFDASDPAHQHFAQAAAILRAEVYGIPRPAWALDATKVGVLYSKQVDWKHCCSPSRWISLRLSMLAVWQSVHDRQLWVVLNCAVPCSSC
jgi:hypothetical protein